MRMMRTRQRPIFTHRERGIEPPPFRLFSFCDEL